MLLVGLGLFAVCRPATANQFVRLEYNLTLWEGMQNTVVIELFDDRPLTRDNFMLYVDGDLYDGTIMHRLVPGFVLQGGGFYETFTTEPPPIEDSVLALDSVDLDGNPGTPNPPVDNEFDNSPFRSNLRGTLAMAKTAVGPDSATNQYFFNLADNSANLDNQNGGFTVFAEVVGDGMDLIDAFAALSKTNLNPVGISGPFTDVPFLGSQLVRVDNAEEVNYLGSDSITDVPESGLLLTSQDVIVENGASFIGTGQITLNTNTSLEAADGATVAGELAYLGTLKPGLQMGILNVDTLLGTSLGTLEMQVRGTTPGVDHDQIQASTFIHLNGALKIVLESDFNPIAGDSFTLLETAGSINQSSSFTSVDLPELTAGGAWDLNVTIQEVVLSVMPDYNQDGLVNDADLALWESDFGSTTELQADGNGNGVVDGDDFLIWQRFVGRSVSTGASVVAVQSVPEPSSLVLLSFLACCSPRRRKPNATYFADSRGLSRRR